MNRDPVDRIVAQWGEVRPDLDTGPMATFGRFGRLHALASRAIEEVLGRHGLGVGEFDVLAALRRSGDQSEMTPSALSRVLMLSPAGMTNRVDRLVAAGLVERRTDPDDRRSSQVRLTAEGRAVIDAAVADHVANEAGLLAVLTDAEHRALDKALRKLLTQFASERQSD